MIILANIPYLGNDSVPFSHFRWTLLYRIYLVQHANNKISYRSHVCVTEYMVGHCLSSAVPSTSIIDDSTKLTFLFLHGAHIFFL